MTSSAPSVEFPPGCRAIMRELRGLLACGIDGPPEATLSWRHVARIFEGKNVGTGCYSFAWRDVQPLVDMLAGLGVAIEPELDMVPYIRKEATRLLWIITHLHKRLDNMDGTLRPYQIEGAEFLATNDRACIFDEMGLGKTIQALAALPDGAAVLVVCPASLRLTWQAEGEKWRPDIAWIPIDKPADFFVPSITQGVIISPETLVKVHRNNGFSIRDCLHVHQIVDEAHYYKNPTSARTKAMMAVSEMCATTWGMTGTPETKDPRDIVGVLRTFKLFNRAFGTRAYFDRQYGSTFDPGAAELTFPAEPTHPELIVESLSRVSIRRSRIEVLPEVPAKTYAEVRVDIRSSKVKIPETTDEHLRIYEAVSHGGLAVVPAELLSCLALCRSMLAEAKSDAVEAFVRRFVDAGQPLVVGSCNLAPLRRLAEMGYPVISGEVPHAKRTNIVEEFQMGMWPVIGLQTIAGGTGWTLTKAHHMLMVQRDWSPSANTQLEDRICRIGQEADSCVIWDLLANHPLDEIISRNLVQKQTRVTATVNAVRHANTSGMQLVERMRELAEYIK